MTRYSHARYQKFRGAKPTSPQPVVGGPGARRASSRGTREATEAAERSDAAAGGHPGTETETGTGTGADADADAERYRVFGSLVGDVSR